MHIDLEISEWKLFKSRFRHQDVNWVAVFCGCSACCFLLYFWARPWLILTPVNWISPSTDIPGVFSSSVWKNQDVSLQNSPSKSGWTSKKLKMFPIFSKSKSGRVSLISNFTTSLKSVAVPLFQGLVSSRGHSLFAFTQQLRDAGKPIRAPESPRGVAETIFFWDVFSRLTPEDASINRF